MSISRNFRHFNKSFSTVNKRKYATSPKKGWNEDYQYLQRSSVPTMHFQKSLPRLPIPVLKNTCDRYLAAQKPITPEEEFWHIENQVHSFANGIGQDLDSTLKQEDKKNSHTSYISKMWFDMYLSDRIPLPINYNPFFIFNNDPKPEFNNQLIRASNFLISATRFMLSLRAGLLEPEVFHLNPKKSDTKLFKTVTGFLPQSLSWYGAYAFKAFPLDMSQYQGLFGSTRIPEQGMDRIMNDYNSKHILVQRKGHFYIFDVLDAKGKLISPSQIISRLSYILSDPRPETEYPVGILTAQDRDVWASQRHHLSQVGNGKVMKAIDTAIFNLVLDDETMDGNYDKSLRNFLHGDGNNRWFDKSFSLIVAKDGVSGINFEHSWGDGVAVLRFFQDVYKETINNPFVSSSTSVNEPDLDTIVKKLDFNLDDKLKESITLAKKAYDKWYKSLDIDYLIYEGLGKKRCKELQLSPDSVMQLGFQAAYHLMTGKYVGTYESCSTSAFKHGRTETMRPCTMDTKAFCDALHSGKSVSTSTLAEMIKTCSATHNKLTKDAAMGQGFDRHLFALRKLAEQQGLPTPGMFLDPEYKNLNTSILSTSTLNSPALMAGGFGPTLSNGYGIGYSVMDNAFGTVVSGYPQNVSITQFKDALEKSYKEIEKVLTKSKMTA